MSAAGPQVSVSDDAGARAARLSRANINPVTGLASDYLNHFNEAIMLLDMVVDCPDCAEEFLAWRPKSYREHFAQSHFKERQLALSCYKAADPVAKAELERLADTMTAALRATGAIMAGKPSDDTIASLAGWSAGWLRPLVAKAGAIINGEHDAANAPQAAIDLLMKR